MTTRPSPRDTERGTQRERDRAPLTRERVLDAAIELADEHGVDGLSMRKLAAHLGYEVMSLYNHVRNKDDLLEAMLDAVYATIDLPDVSDVTDDAWQPAMRALAVDIHAAQLAHRWVPPLIPQVFPGPHRFAMMERVLDLLRRGGFDDDLRDLGFHAITLHISGFAQQRISYSAIADQADDLMKRFADEVRPDTFPLMLEHAAYHERHDQHDASDGDRPDEFEFVLDLILDGLERRRHRA